MLTEPEREALASSPRERGSAGDEDDARPGRVLLPARAGVSRASRSRPTSTSSPPRASGGQPYIDIAYSAMVCSSPRERGSAGEERELTPDQRVLPARAGVSRSSG
ncbi:hypothetical protein KCH_76990 [Kitasatospora cheerisanensis KCTC 2395]|uniref:Uncharacterized protein n=1 Tax=Kitasatospora cheerisanensis KCTC 2395 TaxID=1348663 RepID=A0A066YHD6_9ACTN|nr:hypothetical protein KCH_76990 [Kitasatospora cheerisanensis KCTC 2395]